MKYVRGLKIGGLQQKILNLTLIFVLLLVGAFVAVSVYQQHHLSDIVSEAGNRQQASITDVSEATMEAVLEQSLTKTTALQAYIAGDLFGDVKADVQTLQAFATELFAHEEQFSSHPFSPPLKEKDGVPSVYVLHEEGADPQDSGMLGLIANMSEVMMARFSASDKLSGCFVGTADGNLLAVNDRAGVCLAEDGTPQTIDVRNRPWYRQAAEAGELIFTGVELDSYTGFATLECAAPVYKNGELVCVVGADIFLTAINDYIVNTSTDESFLFVVSDKGQVLFSPATEGTLKAEHSAAAADLRQSENGSLAGIVKDSLSAATGLRTVTFDGKEYYMTGSPLGTVGWAVVAAVDKEYTYQPTAALLQNYDEINDEATRSYQEGAKHSMQTFLVLTVTLILLATVAALLVAYHIAKPIEHMTKRVNALSGKDILFKMEDVYRTDDEIQVLAESFASLSKKTVDYIAQITDITAEKERIGTELALATRIQADMLPNIFPAFPERKEFDIFATMDPAKEVGGDFYDFFLIDDTHLGIVMADVSGKGVPAALFMMISKILVQNYAMTGRSPAEVLKAVNDQICANNREEMFVTAWLGILDTGTGKIVAANAGHEYPVLMQPGGGFELIKDKHGFVIGGMEGMKYKEYELQLSPGAKLFLYTDGVPEAMNGENELFGTERMLAALNENTSASPEELLKNVRRAVDGFVKDAEQFDDLTMLGLEYKGVSEE
ncbi:MAG: SpoIIE family protein phosphatase [Clostridium sp.]|nr:SpoIIE family protein phosphatase [Clostridium sp.]